MANQDVTVRMIVNADGVVTGVRLASQEVGKVGSAAERAGNQAANGFGRARKGVESISKQLSALKAQMLAFIGISQLIQAGKGVARMADEWSNVGARLTLATKGTIAQGAAMEAVYRISQDTSTAVATTGDLVARLASNLAGMGVESDKAFGTALALAKTINQTFAISGASAAAQSNAITQFTQSLAGGILRAEEFNSVIENSPRLAQAIADGMGKSMGELRKAVNEGKVSATNMLIAIQSQAGKVNEEFSKLPLTIDRAWTQLQNSVLRYIGTVDQSNGASAKVAQGIQSIGQHIDVVINSILRLGAIVVAVYTVQMLQAGRVWIASLIAQGLATDALAAKQAGWAARTAASFSATIKSIGVLGAAFNVLAAAFVGWQIGSWLNQFEIVRVAAAHMIGTFLDGWNRIKQVTLLVWEAVKLVVIGAINNLRTSWADFIGLYASALEKLPKGEALAAPLRSVEAQLRPTSSALDNFRSAAGKVNASADTQSSAIWGNVEAMKAYERQAQAAKDAAKEYAASGVITANTLNAAFAELTKSVDGELDKLKQQNFLIGKGSEGQYEYAKSLAMAKKETIADAVAKAEWVAAVNQAYDPLIKQAKANDGAREAQRKHTTVVRDATKANDQAREAQRRYTAQAALATAELAGPLAAAQERSKQKIAELDEALKKHTITTQAYLALKAAEEAALAKQAEDINQRVQAPQALLDTMTGELRLLQKIGPERELERRRLQAQAEMQRELAQAREAAGDAAAREQRAIEMGYSSWQAYEAAMLGAADAIAKVSMQIEEHAAQAEDWARAWKDAVSDVADAFTRFVMSGLRDFKNFGKDLKSIAKQLIGDLVRTFLQQKIVLPIQTQITQAFSGGGASAGGIANMFGSLGDTIVGGFAKLFGRGGGATKAIAEGTTSGMAAWTGSLVESGSMQATVMAGMPASKAAGLGGYPMLGALGGAVMGYGMGGDGAGKVLGGLAGGVAGYGVMVAGGAAMAASAAGAGLMGAASAGLAAVPVVGWIALAALAINKISGGKLFGTKYATESAAQQFDINQAGASGYTSVTEVKQRSLFRGRSWRTTTSPLEAEAQAAINDLYAALKETVATASARLGIAVPNIVGGSFRREFDENGNLTREFGTIAGRVYNEAQEAFAARLVGENLLAVAKAAGSPVELEQLANAYRGTGEQLQDFATLALAIQEDFRSANGVWKLVDGDAVMTRIVHYIEDMAKAGETLSDAYARVQQALANYGALIGGVRAQIATHGLNQYQKAQLEVELQYRAQVKQANELAKALGLSGARAEDLAAIEQLRALQMADLAKQYANSMQSQNQKWLEDLGLSDLSPLRDDQKLANAMQALQTAVDAGDMQRAQKLAEQALGLGRNLYASGADYNSLYDQVTGLVGDIDFASMEDLQGLTNEALQALADLVDGLPTRIAQELADVILQAPPITETPQPVPAPTPVPPPPPSGGGGGGGGVGDGTACVATTMVMGNGRTAGDVLAGDVHNCFGPSEGFTRQPLRWAGEPVLQPCVRLVTSSGAALVCSVSTPFTAVDAPMDAPEYTTLAPEMLGKEVFVRRNGRINLIERVAEVQDAGMQLVAPLDFGGRSFPAGEALDALIYSHNMQKAPQLEQMGFMPPEMARSLASIDDSLLRVADAVETQNRKLDQAQLDQLNGAGSLSWKPTTGGVMY